MAQQTGLIGPVISLRPGSQRAEDWQSVFGRLDDIPVTQYFTTLANLPDRPNSAVYLLDLKRMTPAERERLIWHIAARFDIPAEEVARDLDREGCPILAADVIGPAIPFRLLV